MALQTLFKAFAAGPGSNRPGVQLEGLAGIRLFQISPAGQLRPEAFVLSLALHALLLLTPLPVWQARPARALEPEILQVEYDLRTLGSQVRLPTIGRTSLWSKTAKRPRLRPGTYNPQVIVSTPAQPNHPRQLLFTDFRALPPRAFSLPNIVVPPAVEPVRLAAILTSPPIAPALNPRNLEKARPAEKQLETLRPVARLAHAPAAGAESNPPDLTPPLPQLEGLPEGLVALSTHPVRPTPTLKIPQTRLKAHLAAGPKPSVPDDELVGGGLGLELRDVGVGSNGPAVLGPAVVGPSPPVPVRRPEANRAESKKRPEERGLELYAALAAGERIRRFYTTYLYIENLSSQSSSWVVQYAEMPDKGAAGDNGDAVTAPRAVEKVDPCYPGPAIGERHEGTVVLYAVIRADGRVEDVAVLGGPSPRANQLAAAALARSRFEPARRDGQPVAVEALIEIPFRLALCF